MACADREKDSAKSAGARSPSSDKQMTRAKTHGVGKCRTLSDTKSLISTTVIRVWNG
jgi:hypothetical protein